MTSAATHGKAVEAPMRLGIFVTHPIQYFAPLWRALARSPGVELTVYFFSDHSVRGGVDPGFGVPVAWDVPILDGYPHRFLSRTVDLSRPRAVRLSDAPALLESDRLDAVLVHGYTHRFEAQVVSAARSLGRGTLLRGEHTDAPAEARPWAKRAIRAVYLRWFFSQIDAFCVVGQRARHHLVEAGIPAVRLFPSPYSVDVDLFEAQRTRFQRAVSRRELGVPETATMLLSSGKLTERKDPILLLNALALLERRDDVWLAFVGDGDLRSEVEHRGRALLRERLLMPGFVNQSQVGRYFAAADVFVFPSRFETWGLVVNEAMQFELPVVCSDGVGSAADLVTENETGLLFPVGDARALAACLQRLHGDVSLRKRLGMGGHARIGGYTPQTSANGILAALHSLPSRP